MVVYGTEVTLDPLWSVIYSKENPALSVAAFIVHNAAGLVGYLMMTYGLLARPSVTTWVEPELRV
jgi:hypothetical protein